MDQQKIDQLFREKLDSFEVAPSAGAWSKVEKKITTERNPVKFYWIAASVSLLIITWVVWPQESVNDLTPIASEINHPVQIEGPELLLPQAPVITKKEERLVVAKVMKQPAAQLVANTTEAGSKEAMEESIPELNIENAVVNTETMQPEVLKQPELEKLETFEPAAGFETDLSKVKITYISSATEKRQAPDSVSGIKKLFAIAGKLSPGDVLADIKTAKDDFINGGFKNKNKDRTSL
ncbi:MAG: hypothetical protein RIM99_05680 [Cyclobacteriaceae bacterium]